MAGRDIKVRFEGDASDLIKASNQAEKAVDDVAGGKGGGGIAGLLGGLGGIAGPAGLAAGALAGVGAAAWGLAQGAMEDQKSASMLAQNLKQAAGASTEAVDGAEAFISKLSMQAAIADDELRPALSKLAVGTGDTALAQERLALAADIAAGSGKDLNTVAEAMMKAEQGNTGALGRLGLETKNAAGETMSLNEILDGAKSKFAGAAEAAGNADGGVARAGIAFGEAQEQIGSFFLPVIEKAATFLTDTLLPAFQTVVTWVQENWPRIYDEYIAPVMASIQELIGVVLDTVKQIWDEWGDEILKAVEIYFGLVANNIKFVLDIITGVIKFFVAIFKGDWGAAWDAVKGIASAAVDWLKGIFEKIGPLITDALKGLANVITAPFRAAFNLIVDIWNNTIGKLEWTVPDWIPGLGGKTIAVPDLPHWEAPFAASAAVNVFMPAGSDGYDVARQLAAYQRNAGGTTGPMALV